MSGINKIRQRLQEENCDAFISMNRISRRYLTNFTGSAGLVWIGDQTNILVTDFRYTEQAREQCPDWQVIQQQNNTLLDSIKHLIDKYKAKRIAFESEYITVDQLNQWQQKLSVEFVVTKDWVLDMRMVKNNDEIKCIATAARLTDQALANVIPMIKPGIREVEIALELEYAMRRLGAEAIAFDPIVGSGPRGALPHALPGARKIKKGDFIVIDMGCVYQGYCSDMTRTLLVGDPTEKHLEIYNLVLKAQLAALEVVKPGIAGKQVDSTARKLISDAGYGDNFGHALGHGVGLEIHENPRLSPHGEHELVPGMVVTVEPGIYLTGWGGVRIEDLVVVTDYGREILSQTSKDLYIID